VEKTKAIGLMIAASVLLVAVAGIAYSQVVSAQNLGATNAPTQSQQGISTTSVPYPQQGYYPYGPQYGSPSGHRMGMGMCARFW
jgi:hypothetical protein